MFYMLAIFIYTFCRYGINGHRYTFRYNILIFYPTSTKTCIDRFIIYTNIYTYTYLCLYDRILNTQDGSWIHQGISRGNHNNVFFYKYYFSQYIHCTYWNVMEIFLCSKEIIGMCSFLCILRGSNRFSSSSCFHFWCQILQAIGSSKFERRGVV